MRAEPSDAASPPPPWVSGVASISSGGSAAMASSYEANAVPDEPPTERDRHPGAHRDGPRVGPLVLGPERDRERVLVVHGSLRASSGHRSGTLTSSPEHAPGFVAPTHPRSPSELAHQTQTASLEQSPQFARCAQTSSVAR